jgi:hypothetical protein
VAAAEVATAERLADLRALGTVELALTARRAGTLKARAYDGDLARVILPEGSDLGWIRATADPSADLASPLKGPYATQRDGDASLHRAALALCKQAHLLPAALVVVLDAQEAARLARRRACPSLDAASVPEGLVPRRLAEVSSARVPLDISERGRVRVFRDLDGSEEHYAVEVGAPDRSLPVLCRLHSACFTGDLIGSLKCDCGPQLRAALDQIGAEGQGVLLYLNQEGGGSGSPTRCAPIRYRTRASTRWRRTTGSGSRTTSATSGSAPTSCGDGLQGGAADDQQPRQGGDDGDLRAHRDRARAAQGRAHAAQPRLPADQGGEERPSAVTGFERPAGREDLVVTRWSARFLGRRFPVAVGRGGIGVKRARATA